MACVLIGCIKEAASPSVLRTTKLTIQGVKMVCNPDDSSLAICGYRRQGEERTVPALTLLSLTGEEIWSREHSGLSVGVFRWIDRTSDGGFVTVGSTGDWGDDGSDISVIRLDNTGSVLWEKHYGGTKFDWPASVIETRDGDVLVSGATVSFGAGNLDAYVIRLSPAGELIWDHTYGAEGWEGQYESGSRAFQTKDGRFILVGSTDSDSLVPKGTDVAVYLVRIGTDGSKVWERTYGMFDGFDVGTSVEELEEGGFLLAGIRDNAADGIYLVRTDADGYVLWERTVEFTGSNGYVPLAKAQDGFLVGNRRRTSIDGNFAHIVKVDLSGQGLWELDLGREGSHRLLDISCGVRGECWLLCHGSERDPYLVTLSAEDHEDSAAD